MRLSLLLAANILLSGPALAQNPNLNDAAMNAKRAHNDCFFRSATAQLRAMPSPTRQAADINMVAEQAFAACSTEEQVLAAIVIRAMQPSMAQIGLLGNRTGLKRELNEIFQHPERFAK